jgi:hypothetical protein
VLHSCLMSTAETEKQQDTPSPALVSTLDLELDLEASKLLDEPLQRSDPRIRIVDNLTPILTRVFANPSFMMSPDYQYAQVSLHKEMLGLEIPEFLPVTAGHPEVLVNNRLGDRLGDDYRLYKACGRHSADFFLIRDIARLMRQHTNPYTEAHLARDTAQLLKLDKLEQEKLQPTAAEGGCRAVVEIDSKNEFGSIDLREIIQARGQEVQDFIDSRYRKYESQQMSIMEAKAALRRELPEHRGYIRLKDIERDFTGAAPPEYRARLTFKLRLQHPAEYALEEIQQVAGVRARRAAEAEREPPRRRLGPGRLIQQYSRCVPYTEAAERVEQRMRDEGCPAHIIFAARCRRLYELSDLCKHKGTPVYTPREPEGATPPQLPAPLLVTATPTSSPPPPTPASATRPEPKPVRPRAYRARRPARTTPRASTTTVAH